MPVSVDDCVTQIYPVRCKGRDANGNEALTEAVGACVQITKSAESNMLSSTVNCRYNTGGHGQRCKASHPEVDKVGEGVGCPYSFDIPYALEKRNRR